MAIALPGLFSSIVKNMIGRARPGVGGSLNPSLFDPFHWAPAYAGLPSGHATTAFAALAAFGMLWPRARTALLIFALLIAASRIIVTALYINFQAPRCAGSNQLPASYWLNKKRSYSARSRPTEP